MRGQVAVEDILGHHEQIDAPQVDLKALNDHLDSLWARYLDLLDDYAKAQASIKKHTSSGFFSLAQANSKSSGSGRRYGSDYYDDRASAIAKAEITVPDEASTPRVNVVKEDPGNGDSDFEIVEKIEAVNLDAQSEDRDPSTVANAKQLPTPEATPEPESKSTESSTTSEKSHAKPQIHQHDPLRWFGILIPPALRQAQKSFLAAIFDGNAVTQAVNAARGMRELEVEIRKLRKTIKKAERAPGAHADSATD